MSSVRPLSLLLALSLLPLAASAQDNDIRQPPAPHCMDARKVDDVQVIDTATLALRLTDGGRYRMSLQEDCPGVGTEPVNLLARGGWFCGNPDEAIRTATASCAVTAVEPQDSRQYAELLRSRASTLVNSLPSVAVTGTTHRGFAGSPDYCVGIRDLRSWREDPQGVVVEVSPRRSGGHRYYRLELGSSCGDLSNADTLTLLSGVGLAQVCGHPGDRLRLSRAQPTPVGDFIEPDAIPRPQMQSKIASTFFGCPIARVYPLPASS
ncbi:hypothetical protein ARC78_16120 [Stenotrophomonas pictorum JCM 9942]|uniref:Uncharacterized protein n=1 Tax=Stenotrophomonas pictorum JCM 9942 TaxID=1236960 RepID=A0A0R0A844_9GAMM|nr:hypothetical protein [Stenotrophomonas pictorum]KRG37431.1 hypothetical protein ARC78_16120 [Stenotrophomonas pictorum JCM 9942]